MKKGIHRRNFIRSTALAGAGVLVAKPFSPLLAFNGSPNEKVVVGVVGTNSRGATLANIFASTPNVEVGYICDVDENVLNKTLALIEKKTGKFMGRCGLTPMDIEGREEIEVGYMLAQEYWGRGLATEAARAILHYGFEQVGLVRLICVINPGNQASGRVAEKIGMRLEIDGDINGEPTLLYSINK